MQGVSTQTQVPLTPPFRFFLLAAVLAALLGPPLAVAFAAGADAGRFIESIYAHGHEDAVASQWSNAGKRGAWLSRDLTALWSRSDARARKSKDELGALDFDIGTNSQLGWEAFMGFTVNIVSQGDGRAVVNVRLENAPDTAARKFDSDNVIRYDLVEEGGAWRIDDVGSTVDGKPWSLREILKAYLKGSAT